MSVSQLGSLRKISQGNEKKKGERAKKGARMAEWRVERTLDPKIAFAGDDSNEGRRRGPAITGLILSNRWAWRSYGICFLLD